MSEYFGVRDAFGPLLFSHVGIFVFFILAAFVGVVIFFVLGKLFATTTTKAHEDKKKKGTAKTAKDKRTRRARK